MTFNDEHLRAERHRAEAAFRGNGQLRSGIFLLEAGSHSVKSLSCESQRKKSLFCSACSLLQRKNLLSMHHYQIQATDSKFYWFHFQLVFFRAACFVGRTQKRTCVFTDYSLEVATRMPISESGVNVELQAST